MRDFPLVVFTLLVQISAGIMGTTLMNIWTGSGGVFHIPFNILSTCLGLMILGLISALAHLGNPGKALHAVSNSGRSWLSREIVFIGLLIFCISVLWVLTGAGFQKNLFLIEAASLIIGISTVWTMSQVYGLKTVPAWNHMSTAIDFFGTALLSGAVASQALDQLMSDKAPGLVFLICSCLGLVCKIASICFTLSNRQRSKNLFWYASSRAGTSGKAATYTALSCLYTMGFFLFAAGSIDGSWLSWDCPGRTGQPLFLIILSLIVILVTEIWHRFCFYDSFCRVGL